jgi:hypothetical protein
MIMLLSWKPFCADRGSSVTTRFTPTLFKVGILFATAAFVVSSAIPTPAAPPPGARDAQPKGIFVRARAEPWNDVAMAGLPSGSHPEVLTWKRAYILAVVRCRTQRAAGKGLRPRAPSLDPTLLTRQAGQVGFADFERFRKDFFGQARDPQNPGTAFVDPSGALYGLLRQVHKVETARQFVFALEELKTVAEQLLAEPGKPADLGALERRIEKARRRRDDEIHAYRDQLGKVKVELGLVPDAPVVPDRTLLVPFRTIFNSIDDWFRDPAHNPDDLPGIVAALPELQPESRIVGQFPRGLDGVSDDARQGVRELAATRAVYETAKQRLLEAMRAKHQAFELMMTAGPRNEQLKETPDLIAVHAQFRESEDQVVAHWISFLAQRMVVARDARVLPGHDWPSFLAEVEGRMARTPAPGKNQYRQPPDYALPGRLSPQ